MRLFFSLLKLYWLRVVVIAIAGIYLGHKVDDTDWWSDTRYSVYQFLQNLTWRRAAPHRTVLVLIGDEEYWKGELQSRTPLKRDYLARIVQASSEANAAIIALDFDLRSPSPVGDPVEFPEYQVETDKLKRAIDAAGSDTDTLRGKKIVLAKTIRAEDDETFATESDIYDPLLKETENISTGYHVFSDDTRRFPPVLSTKTGQKIEPFSLAIARAANARALKNISDFSATLYSGFIPIAEFEAVYARDLLKEGKKPEILANSIVIVGGVWHQFGYNRGPQVNAYDTPVGNIPGIFIHANYLEALLDSRIFRVWEGRLMTTTEFALALLVALPFGIKLRSKKRRAALIAAPYLLIVLISYFSLINFGWFFDPFIPVLSVSAHGALERVLHWRASAAL